MTVLYCWRRWWIRESQLAPLLETRESAALHKTIGYSRRSKSRRCLLLPKSAYLP